MIEHPIPTVSTAKQLYATAVRCGFPGCSQPLYTESPSDGVWALNSKISHIFARREGGPRWNKSQSAEENRSAANLILMCHQHAAEIDDKHGRIKYSAETLLEWKQGQLQLHRQMSIGWPLTDKMAKDALAVSFTSSGIVINNSNLRLGGEGGKAPGAGGGGGGAIGKNARGGRGGRGGRITDLEGNFLSPDEFEPAAETLQTRDVLPGAGGGGAPAFGDGAVAGDGGNGGDIATGILEVEPGEIFEIVIGEGGRPPHLPGQHGSSGEDAVIVVRTSDGRVKRTIKAGAGKGAEAGRLPDDWVPVSNVDLVGGFGVTTLMLVNAVDIRDGLLFVLGGGWAKYSIPSVPLDTIWTLVCIASWKSLAQGPTRGLQVCLGNPSGKEVSRVAIGVSPEFQKGSNVHWVVNIGAPLDAPGYWNLSVRSGDLLLAELPVLVEITPAT